MSPITQFGVLAFASTVLAIPGNRNFGHKHQYGHHHGHKSSSSAVSGTGSGVPFPYPVANATGIYGSTGFGSGTAVPTGYASSSSVAVPVGPATVTVSPVPYSASSSASSVSSVENAASTSECTTDITVTTTEKTYVTVTSTSGASSSVEVSATQEANTTVRSTVTITKHSTFYYTPSSSAVESSSAVVSSSSSAAVVSSSSSEAAPVTTSATSSAAAYTPASSSSSVVVVSSSSSTEVAPVTTSASSSSAAAPSTSSSSEAVPITYSEVQKAPAPSAYSSAAPSSYSSSASSSSAAATPSSYSSGSGKRGIAYNVTDNANTMISAAGGSQVSWAYNWLSSSKGIDSGVNYIPMMHAPESPFSDWWPADAQAGIDAGASVLFSFNEPDQSGLQPQDVAGDWATYMAPFNGKAKLVAPSVTNGGGSMGLSWLSSFLGYCSECQIDAVNIHWYNPYSSTSAQDFKDQVTNAINIKNTGDMPVYVTEFGLDGASDDEIKGFLEEVMPWMDSNSNVVAYAYFMAYDSMLLSGSSVSEPIGSTYMSYTG